MKIITISLLTLFFGSHVKSQQLCKEYITNEWPDSRYIVETIDGDNVVTDKQTGLMWKQCSEGLSGADCTTGAADSENWENAFISAGLQNLVQFAGYTDWRLPNLKELRSIRVSNCDNPSINVNIFPNTVAAPYWSSSPIMEIGYDNSSWVVNFGTYEANFIYNRNDLAKVRLVRSTQ